MEEKESSPESSSFLSSSVFNEDTSSGELGAVEGLSINHLHLQVPSRASSSTNSSPQSSPRPSTTSLPSNIIPARRRGDSSSSSLSLGEISIQRNLADISQEFQILKILHEGRFSKILLARQCPSRDDTKYLVLKAVLSGGLFTDDFKRELTTNYFLSPHPNILTCFNTSFNWASRYNVYVQEHAPLGDLSQFITQNQPSSLHPCKYLPECHVKLIGAQLASALEFVHSYNLVHQNVCPENVLVFKGNMTRVKLSDFGETRKEGSSLTKSCYLIGNPSYLPPELSYLLPQERYECRRSCDAWQLGILLGVCLSGRLPWELAEFSDSAFRQYTSWLKRKSLKCPEALRKYTPRLVRMMKRLLEPKQPLRAGVAEVLKYLKDDWMKPSCIKSARQQEKRENNLVLKRPVKPTGGSIAINLVCNLSDDKDKDVRVEEIVGQQGIKRVENWVASVVQQGREIETKEVKAED